LRTPECLIGRRCNFSINIIFDSLQTVLVDYPFIDQSRAKLLHWIAFGIGGSLFIGPIQSLIIRERVRIRSDYFCVYQGRAFSIAAVLNRLVHHLERFNRIRAIACRIRRVARRRNSPMVQAQDLHNLRAFSCLCSVAFGYAAGVAHRVDGREQRLCVRFTALPVASRTNNVQKERNMHMRPLTPARALIGLALAAVLAIFGAGAGVRAAHAASTGTGLVAAYAFDEGSGGTVADASGNGNTGSIQNATWTSGKYGSALSFPGSDSWVNIPDAPSLHLSDGMTLEAWVKPAALGSSWRTVVLKQQSGAVDYALYANNDTGDQSGHVYTTSEPTKLGLVPMAETAFLIDHLFGGDDGLEIAERIDRRIDRLPGLGGLGLCIEAREEMVQVNRRSAAHLVNS